MNHPPLVFILVLNYNGRETLSACIRSLFHLKYSRFQIVIIDNDSTDGSFEIAKEKYPEAHFIKNSENIGFARGMNVGIRFALDHGADYIWLVNPDALVSKDSLSLLVQLLEQHPQVGMASPLILSPSRRKLWFGGGKIAWFRMRAIHLPSRSRTIPFETGFLSGCVLFVRSSTFRAIGLFDKRFFLYYEDADLSLRAKRAGLSIVVHPKAIVLHSEESRKNSDKTYWLVRSALFFFRKNTPLLGQPFFWTAFGARKMWQALRHIREKKRTANKTAPITASVQKAFRDFWKYGY